MCLPLNKPQEASEIITDGKLESGQFCLEFKAIHSAEEPSVKPLLSVQDQSMLLLLLGIF